MGWRVELTPAAKRDLKRLEKKTAKRLVAKLEQAAEDPIRMFQRMTDSNLYRMRIGDPRVLAHLLHHEEALVVMRVEHRSRAYR